MAEKRSSFEESLEKLEKASERLRSQEVPLEEAIKEYREGLKYYKKCREILDKAAGEIETLTEKVKS